MNLDKEIVPVLNFSFMFYFYIHLYEALLHYLSLIVILRGVTNKGTDLISSFEPSNSIAEASSDILPCSAEVIWLPIMVSSLPGLCFILQFIAWG